ncbi:MAG: UDP-N-acetylmuramate--L-alanine ligase [Alphaproteobacteria bacterium]
MKTIPFDIGLLHFVGIGGIGMSGIAEVMHTLGYRIQGSDQVAGANVKRLQALGITIHIGQSADNLGDARVVIVSSAIKPDNPELMAARERQIPVVRRAEMLAELMRLKWSIAVGGTHGKTTTTSLVAAVLEAGRKGPTVINGGIINAYGTNAVLGPGEWMVVEADESDGTFVKLPATVTVVTNIDPEHMDHYGDIDALRDAFEVFVENIPFYGFAVMCMDHPEVQAMMGRIHDRRIISYGFSPQADVQACNVSFDQGIAKFDVLVREWGREEARELKGLTLPMPGRHNVQNTLAAIAIGLEMGISEEQLRRALTGFAGVKRRFTRTGVWNDVTIIDDYGHHPVEIAAVLEASRSSTKGKVIAVVQPHRYTRLANLFDEFCTCFNDADAVVVADVYDAGESPIDGASKDSLVQGLRDHGHRRALPLDGPDALAPVIRELAEPGDLVVCLGAGSITAWANALPEQLRVLSGQSRPIGM